MKKIYLYLWVWSMLLTACSHVAEEEKNSKFTLIDAATHGIDFINSLIYTEEFNVYLFKSFYNGAGVGMGDFNNDGLVDLFFCGNQSGNKAYLNLGNFEFKEFSEVAGLGSNDSWSTGVSVVDINGDGWMDIYVCKSGRQNSQHRHNELFINQGLNAEAVPFFKESSEEYGIADVGFSVHALFFDYDRDNDLDLYLLNNSISPSEVIIEAKRDLRNKRDPGGNKLYRNEGGHFTDASEFAGIYSSAIGFGLGASIGDINKDGWLDIYVANDFFEKDYLYINNRNGTFTESLNQVLTEISLGSMSVDLADINNDGYPEIFVTEMLPEDQSRLKTKALFDNWDSYALKVKNGYYRQFPRNTLQLNNGWSDKPGKISFSEISRYAGVHATDWSWGVFMQDLDNDGYKEIFITNGLSKDLLDQDYIDFYTNPDKVRSIYHQKGAVIKELIDSIPSQAISNYVFSQNGNMEFRDMASIWGMDNPSFSTGAAYGDLDNDGDLDVVVSNINEAPFLYRNETYKKDNAGVSSKAHYLNVALRGLKSNTNALGAQVTLKAQGKLFYQELLTMRGSMSTVDNRLNFGLGSVAKVDTLEVRWPDGSITRRSNVSVDQFITIREEKEIQTGNTIATRSREPLTPTLEWLSDVSGKIDIPFRHVENDYVDFNQDRLLIHMVSNLGPALAEGQANQDGLSDFYIGGARGKSGALFIGNESGGFKETSHAVFAQDSVSEDTDAVFVDVDGDHDQDLLVASGGYEFSENSFALANRLYLNDGKGNFHRSSQVIPNNKLENTSVILPSDIDNDGDQDLFVGTRGKPLRYGVSSDSYLLENDGKGIFTNVTESKAPGLLKLGMVTDAVWVDYDKDGDQDLAIVGDWMPVKIFKNTNGIFKDESTAAGLNSSHGFWNVIEKADLDEDGDLDLIAGNLGYNSMLRASVEKPVRMYVGDFDQNGEVEQIITTYDGDGTYPLSTKKEIVSQIPHLKKKYLRYKDFALEHVEDVFSEAELASAVRKEVFTTASTIFWNERGTFKAQLLPFEAQMSPTYSILVDDLDGDGHQEIVLGGNQFRAKPQVGIYAASYGTVLTSKNDRQFTAVPSKDSGFFVDGEIRKMVKLSERDKSLLLIARNDDSVRVFEYNKSITRRK